jgi:hypothetical protein
MAPSQEKPRGEWDGEERRAQHWHLKKEVTVGQIVTLATMLATAIGYVVSNERAHERHAQRIDSQDRMIQRLEQSDRDGDAKLNMTVGRIEVTVQRVDDKLNRLIENAARR